MEQNKRNLKLLLFFCAIFFLLYKFFPEKKYRQITGIEVDTWAKKIKPGYFKGRVESIEIPDNRSRVARTIYLKVLDTADIVVPDSCEYFKFKNGFLLLTVSNLNISTGPGHEIKEGDVIMKFRNDNSILVYSGSGCRKFYFPLFDILGSDETPRMIVTAKSPCP